MAKLSVSTALFAWPRASAAAGCARRRKHFSDPHGFHIFPKLPAENAVLVAQQLSMDLIQDILLPDLLRCPFRAGVGGYIEMDYAATLMSQQQEHIQHREAGRWYG